MEGISAVRLEYGGHMHLQVVVRLGLRFRLERNWRLLCPGRGQVLPRKSSNGGAAGVGCCTTRGHRNREGADDGHDSHEREAGKIQGHLLTFHYIELDLLPERHQEYGCTLGTAAVKIS